MRLTKTFLIFSLVIIGWNCYEDNGGPNSWLPSGQATLTSKYIDNKTTGFSFSRADVITFPNNYGILPDFSVLIQVDVEDSIVGVFFANFGEYRPTFMLMKETTSSDSAHAYFQNLKNVSRTDFTHLAIPVKANQVWVVKTQDNKFGKMLILSTSVLRDTSTPTNPKLNGEATFEWVYQPNGTISF